MALIPTTVIPFVDDTGSNAVLTIEQLTAQQMAVDRPIRILSRTPQGIVQQANAIEISVATYVSTNYQLTFEDGSSVDCEAKHWWNIESAAVESGINNPTQTDINGFRYLTTERLAIGDKLYATNEAGFLTIAAITQSPVPFSPYYMMNVPMFGNFMVVPNNGVDMQVRIVSRSKQLLS
ncbi:hypothetical protein EVC12_209 [Rhizobium phage RHph_I42]|nr:hypothetical protein EVC12_209 [Rhizobium phage RHph_I42]